MSYRGVGREHPGTRSGYTGAGFTSGAAVEFRVQEQVWRR